MSTKLDCENVARLAVILARYTKLGFTQCAYDAMQLAKIGRQLTALAETNCNQGLSPRQVTRQINLLKRAKEIVAAEYVGVVVSDQGDPRGYCLRLQFPGGESNNMGGDFGV